jgi:hypothetical protein
MMTVSGGGCVATPAIWSGVPGLRRRERHHKTDRRPGQQAIQNI